MLSEITPLILTFNEAPNLRRSLEQLEWAREVIVLDSFSTDETENIARSFPNVNVSYRRFDTFEAQWNFCIQLANTDWVLTLDADYVVTDALRDEIAGLRTESGTVAYFTRFKYCIAGHPLRGTVYPARAVLFRKSRCHYVADGHSQLLRIDGPTRVLDEYLLHDDRKSLARWLESQRGYAQAEARHLVEHCGQTGSVADRMRRWIWPAAPAAFLYTLFVARCVFDGWPGWYYALQRTYFEVLLSLELLDRRLFGNDPPPTSTRVDSVRND
jgi:glycosyltransferase involved in cell wall biosynthesis